MTIPLLVAGLAAFVLAFANGANDNAKGVATLIGSGMMRPRPAIVFGTVATLLGSFTAIVLAQTLLAAFSGKGIVPESVIDDRAFPLCVGVAAGTTVLVATRLGLPISTTHSIVGALAGVGIASEVIWAGLWTKFAYPLLAAPALAALLTIPVYLGFRWARVRSGVSCRSCICVARVQPVAVAVSAAESGDTLVAPPQVRRVRRGHRADCAEGLDGRIAGVDAQTALDWSHLFTAAAVSFARGVNDTPKIAAILLAAGAVAAAGDTTIAPAAALVVTGIGIALGGLLAARRVANTMSRRITEMNDGQAFTANLVTAAPGIFASRLRMPVSTTHVSCGSLFGIGVANRTARWRTIGTIVSAWVVTLPVALAIGWGAWKLLA
jgi:PiT family inorganic phosphate transporter